MPPPPMPPPSNGGKVTPNLSMDAEGTRLLNLTVLQRLDPAVEDILITAAHVTLYDFNIDLNQWVSHLPPSLPPAPRDVIHMKLIRSDLLASCCAEPQGRGGVAVRREEVSEGWRSGGFAIVSGCGWDLNI